MNIHILIMWLKNNKASRQESEPNMKLDFVDQTRLVEPTVVFVSIFLFL